MPNVKLSAKRTTKTQIFESFRGVDFGSEPGAVAAYRSPDCLNMVSDQSGRPVKRFGYEKLLTLTGKINGIFKLVQGTDEKKIIHCGTKLYLWNANNTTTLLYSSMNDARSKAYQMDGKLWILDGAALKRYDGTSVVTAQSVAYTPTTRIGCSPSGGGTNGEAVNLFSGSRKNEFTPDGTAVTFQVDATNISGVLKVELKNQTSGEWVSQTWVGVDTVLGRVTLAAAPPIPSPSEDTLRITYTKDISGTAAKINQCRTAVLWGIGGYNRMFVTGNPNFPNVDFYSDVTTDTRNAPTYFPDNNYSTVGQDNTKIVGYLRSNDELAILKEDNDQDATVFLRGGSLGSDGKAIFTIKTGIAGVGAVSSYCMKDLRDDHMFLSKQGVFAISTNAVTSERYAQARSEMVNRKLCVEPNLDTATAIEYDGYLYLAVNGHVYVADASQKTATGRNSEQYQYEWYYWENVPVRCWFRDGENVLFGTESGEVMRFYRSKISSSYNDDGKAIRAYWTTPEIAFDTYSKFKTLSRVYAKLNPYARSSLKIYLKEDGAFALADEKTADIFMWDDVDFRRFTFSVDQDVSIVWTKVKLKKVITTQLRLENAENNEAFGIYGATLYYDLKNKVK